ncbi:MAG: hypothetical protein PUA77_02060 [Lachnospiraceae bacterium]|nr:hypothetical protein [Lachnospiraceae bacterium]
MDKYEYSLKLDQMKSLYAEEKYEDAADIADTINWNKVKNVNALVKAGEIYEKTQRYEDSRDILLLAYDRSPIGRMIIYRLAEVAVKMQDFQAAEDYYQEFVEIAPHDSLKYVLRYDIKKAQGVPFSELIPILEELKDQEYTEEWAYELAYLYHKAGMSEKCIDACDELILWFGDGPYVERALELKMLYQPLTKVQEEKYRTFRQARESKAGITHIDIEEMQRAGEYAHDPVTIPQVKVNAERFNTINLQKEIAKGMQQIIEATEKETVSDTMDNINKMVEEIPYLKLPQGEAVPKNTDTHIETDEEIDGSLKINFQEMLGEDSDGQMSLMMDDKTMVERQITGQITIEEVLEEWEKTKRAAEAALEDAKQRKLESAKARALQEAGSIMDRLTDVIPKLDAGVTPKELLEEEYLQGTSQETGDGAPAVSQAMVPELEPAQELPQEEPEDEELKEEEPVEEPAEEELWPEGVSLEEMVQAHQSEIAAGEEFDLEQEPEKEAAEEESQALIEETEAAMEEAEEMVEPETKELEEVPIADLPEKPTLEQEKEEEFAFIKKKPQFERSSWKGKTVRIPQIPVPEDLGSDEADGKTKPIVALTDEQKAIFSYFMPVKGMESQLCKALTGVAGHLQSDETARTGNLIIQGGQGCGKTTLATSIIKVLQQETGCPNGKIGKIHAEALNQRDVGKVLEKVAGGCLIIEQAGELDRQTIVKLSLLLEQDSSGLFVILEDTSKGIKKLFAQDENFAKKFTESISVPIFTNDELVTFARSYSRELGYKIDDMAVLALYNRISNIQRLDQATTLTEVKEIVDEAIEREAHGGLKKAISILTASRYTDDDRIVLREKDFE